MVLSFCVILKLIPLHNPVLLVFRETKINVNFLTLGSSDGQFYVSTWLVHST